CGGRIRGAARGLVGVTIASPLPMRPRLPDVCEKCGVRPRLERFVLTMKRRVERDDEDLLRLYLTDIGQHALLSRGDEVHLAQQMEAGRLATNTLSRSAGITSSERRTLRRTVRQADEAHDTFVLANLRLVVSIAKKYQASGVPLLDLIQE